MMQITDTEWRDCYYLYRAMHDGVCPKCGAAGEEDIFHSEKFGYLQCMQCSFTMAKRAIDAILKRSGEILKRRLESFERVRGWLGEDQKEETDTLSTEQG